MPGNSVTHIAGPALTICGGRVIQRCSLCGEKLIDNRHEASPIGPDDMPDKRPTWEVGRLVRFSGTNPQSQVLLEDTDKLPDDSCLDLVEA
jgi:hypothetical protein